jgi:hypothetical protein
MEEEDWDCFRLFTILLRLLQTQPANATSPKSKKQPKPRLSKMQMQLFFFYHTTKIFLENTLIYGQKREGKIKIPKGGLYWLQTIQLDVKIPQLF